MRVITVTVSCLEADHIFPSNEEGQDVTASDLATKMACDAAGTAELPTWHTPDVFSIRYGSSYVATAKFTDVHVRFLMDDGDFFETDIKE